MKIISYKIIKDGYGDMPDDLRKIYSQNLHDLKTLWRYDEKGNDSVINFLLRRFAKKLGIDLSTAPQSKEDKYYSILKFVWDGGEVKVCYDNLELCLEEMKTAMTELYNSKSNAKEDAFIKDSYKYPYRVIDDIEESILWNSGYGRFDNWKEASETLDEKQFDELCSRVKNITKMSPKEVLDAYLNWNGIIGYTDSIIEAYKENNLTDYLSEEGIIGYDADIQGILKNLK